MSKQISEGRQFAYYLGGFIMAIGAISFISVFITGAMNAGNFSNFDGQMKSSAFRAVGGMICLIVGGIIRGIGAQGLAGSGVILDPEQARDELEPYSRMGGGMIKDALDEADIDLGQKKGSSEKVIMIRCRECGKLNEDDSKFCQECGKVI